MKVTTKLTSFAIICSLLSSTTALANPLEINAMFGQMYSSDLSATDNSSINVDAGSNISIGIAWQESVNGQGQILLNRVSHDFTSENNTNDSLDIIYAHFNGVALFRQQNYVTTMSLGIGGAYFDATSGGEKVYPSATVSLGTRYEMTDNIAIVTELRGYATLIDKDDAMFCQQDICSANFENSVWIDTTISVGIAIKF